MKVLFDTSVLIAGLLKHHQFHADSAIWLSEARARMIEMVISAHTLAEVYSTLTRLPKGHTIAPADVWEMIEVNLLEHAVVRTLPAKQYARLIKRLAAEHLTGGVTYDAVIAEVARLVRSDLLLTLNVSDFERVVRSDLPRIITPLQFKPDEFVTQSSDEDQ